MVAGTTIVLAGLALLGGVLRPPPFTATSVFRPETTGAQGRLAGVAAQLGLGGANLATESVEFYARLLRSTDLLREAVRQPFEIEGQRTASLVDVWGRGNSDAERTRAAVRRLDGATRVRTDWDAGLVAVETSADSPGLAEQLNRRLLSLVNDFNIEKRTTRAAQERRFVDARLAEAKSSLDIAESQLQQFLQRNRTYLSSPQLSLEYERIGRRVQFQQQLYATLAQASEQARIDEVRNTAIITVLQSPEGTARRPGRALRVMIFAALGMFLGVSFALGRESLRFARFNRPEEYVALKTALGDAVGRLRPRSKADGKG